MRCAACGAVNEPGRTYCGGCAHVLGAVCPVCLFLNGEDVRYCGGCARDLRAAATESPPAVRPSAAALVAQRAAATLVPALDLEDLADLAGGGVAGSPAAQQPSGQAESTQDEIDGFFQRLVREGVVEIHPPESDPAAARPGPSRRASS